MPHPCEIFLRWVACYVVRIETPATRRGARVIVIAGAGDDLLAISRSGIDAFDAFTRCVMAGLKKLPLPPAA